MIFEDLRLVMYLCNIDDWAIQELDIFYFISTQINLVCFQSNSIFSRSPKSGCSVKALRSRVKFSTYSTYTLEKVIF